MDQNQIMQIKEKLHDELRALTKEELTAADNTRVVALDQQSVGRLSRMDALQMQAMAQAQKERRNRRKNALTQSLNRLELKKYGYCRFCDEEIDFERLSINPTVLKCFDCSSE